MMVCLRINYRSYQDGTKKYGSLAKSVFRHKFPRLANLTGRRVFIPILLSNFVAMSQFD